MGRGWDGSGRTVTYHSNLLPYDVNSLGSFYLPRGTVTKGPATAEMGSYSTIHSTVRCMYP